MSLVATARKIEQTVCFQALKAKRRWDMTDMLYAIGMKTYNQSQRALTRNLLPFLDRERTTNEISTWYSQCSGALQDGVKQITDFMTWWQTITTTYTTPLTNDVTGTMERQSLENPCAAFLASGAYALSKQVFENSERFEQLLKTLKSGAEYVPSSLFGSNGAIALNPSNGRLKPGVLKKGSAFCVWDCAGNAFLYSNVQWVSCDVKEINSRAPLPSSSLPSV